MRALVGYTGFIGSHLLQQSNFDFCFNVAIRTMVLNHQTQTLSMGIGSGVVMDSDPKEEYRECLLKTAFLSKLSGNSD